MPYLPNNQKCETLGCKNARSKFSIYCIEHGGRDVWRFAPKEHRAENNAYYQTPQWKTMRTMQLGKQPLCQACLCKGIVNTASHIDHLFAWSQLGSHAFYNNILQSLCPECHSSKTALEQQGIYRHYTSDGINDYAIHDYKSIVAHSPV